MVVVRGIPAAHCVRTCARRAGLSSVHCREPSLRLASFCNDNVTRPLNYDQISRVFGLRFIHYMNRRPGQSGFSSPYAPPFSTSVYGLIIKLQNRKLGWRMGGEPCVIGYSVTFSCVLIDRIMRGIQFFLTILFMSTVYWINAASQKIMSFDICRS